MTILSELKTARTIARFKLSTMVSRLIAALEEGVDIDQTPLKIYLQTMSLNRKVTQVEQYWTGFEAAHKAYLVKLNPDDDQLKVEMEYKTTEDTATKEVLEQAYALLDIANAPPVPVEVPGNSGKIEDLKAELVEKEAAEQEVSRVEHLTTDTEPTSTIQYFNLAIASPEVATLSN